MPVPLILGATALGSVCGWWCAPLAAARSRRRSWSAAAAALLAIGAEAVGLGGRSAAIAYPGGVAAGLLLHATFRAVLIARLAHHRSDP